MGSIARSTVAISSKNNWRRTDADALPGCVSVILVDELHRTTKSMCMMISLVADRQRRADGPANVRVGVVVFTATVTGERIRA